ncbi:BQ5605_C031g10951 [Microbotryum silenes-dioicae]|uniref:BQ5605_C031g10951 protein n=1 Tax=Microbotryum silenes-dioicae TaxID=796604 RepID=A0A2X0PHY1_9BASI|nr:BQ5605_C031g10951 [Microbotryum silenes-dioicae]
MQDDETLARSELVILEELSSKHSLITSSTKEKEGLVSRGEKGDLVIGLKKEEEVVGKVLHESRDDDDDDDTTVVRAQRGTTSGIEDAGEQQMESTTFVPTATTSTGTETTEGITATPPPPPTAAVAAESSPASSSHPTPTTTITPVPSQPLPPPLSKSPAPGSSTTTTKKFQSSLLVNKKFLEKAGDKTKPTSSTGSASPELKPNQIRPSPSTLNATTSSATATSAGLPRLLSGKISLTMGSASNSSSNSSPLGNKNSSSSSSAAGGTGSGGAATQPTTTWTKTPVPAQPLPTPTSAPGGLTSEDRAFGRRPPSAFSSTSGGRTDQPWVRGAPRSLDFGATEFPTAAEAANAKALRAQQILEQMQSRDRAIQARAAAAAKANAHLLEGLDAFRGVHLDPNASHWDEMGDEDDNFLDDTIEFADGTQYKISEVAAANNNTNELKEPSPEEMGKLEAPLAPGEKMEEPSRQERFKDDFDRSYGGSRAANDSSSRREPTHTSTVSNANGPSGAPPTRTLFNAKEGRMEPTAPSSSSRSSGPSTRRLSNDVVSIARRGDITSPRLEKASLPPAPATNPWGRVPPTNAVPISTTARRLSMNAGGERQLPPHMMQANQHPSVAQTRNSVLSPPRAREPSLPSTSPSAPAPAPAPVQAPALKEAIAPPPVLEPVEDLEARQAREMHAAAERARVRRQEEERERVAQAERAKKKAQELEERMKAAEEAKKAPVVVQKEVPPSQAAPKVDTWRRTLDPTAPAGTLTAPSKTTATPPVVTSPPSVRTEPIRILSREPKESAPPPHVAITKASSVPPVNESKPTSSATNSTARAPLEPQDRAWRRADVSNGRGNVPPPPTTGYRQPPPHLLAQAANANKHEARVSERERRVSGNAASSSATMEANLEIKLASSNKTTPPQASPSSATGVETITSPRRGNRGQQQQQQQQRENAQFDDLMSRVKNAMASPSSKDGSAEASPTTTMTGQDAPETVVTGSSPPRVKMPVIKLPSSGQNKQAAFASVANSTTIPAATPSGRYNQASVRLPAQPAATPAAPPKPAFELREPRSMFERTARARSPSPGPAWRLYPVKLASYPTARRPVSRYKLRDFNDAMKPLRVALLTWNPPIQGLGTRRLSRDDYLHPKKFTRGIPQAAVQMPKQRIERRTEIEIVIVDRSKPKPAAVNGSRSMGESSRSATPSAFERGWGSGSPAGAGAGRVRPSDAEHWKRATPSKVNGVSSVDTTTAPSTAALFDPATPQRLTPPPSSAQSASQSDSLPSTSKPFLSQVSAAVSAVAASDRTRAVTGDLDGEEVQKTPRASLSAPGAERMEPTSLDKAKASFDATSSRVMPAATSSPWPVGKAPLSLSALDPTASSLWAAPPSEPGSHVRSMSLPRTRIENSLKGLGDDDYPSSIPMSLAELKSEDEGSPERTKGAQLPESSTPVPNNEPKLRAAAPSFSSFHTEHFAAHQSPGSQNPSTLRFSSIQRSVATPSHGVEAYAYSPQLSAATLVGHSYSPAHYATGAPQHYASYSPVQQHQQLSQAQQAHYQGRTTYVPTSAASLYASGVAASEYASVPTTTAHQQQQAYYRAQAAASAQQQQQSQQYLVNPALVAAGYGTSSYGSDAVGAYGAVGGGASRHVSSHGGVSAASTAGGIYAAHPAYGVSPVSRSSMYSPIPSSNRVYVSSNASSHYSHDLPRNDVISSSSYYGSTATPSSTTTTSSTSPYSHSRTIDSALSSGTPATGSSFISGPISPVIMPQHLQPHAVHLVPSGSIGSAFPSTAGAGNRGANAGAAQGGRGGYGGISSSGARAVSANVGGVHGGYQGHQQAGTYRSQW